MAAKGVENVRSRKGSQILEERGKSYRSMIYPIWNHNKAGDKPANVRRWAYVSLRQVVSTKNIPNSRGYHDFMKDVKAEKSKTLEERVGVKSERSKYRAKDVVHSDENWKGNKRDVSHLTNFHQLVSEKKEVHRIRKISETFKTSRKRWRAGGWRKPS